MGRSQLKTLRETTFNSFLDVAKMQGLKAGIHFKVNNQSNIIYMLNGSEILLKDLAFYPSDPNFDELGSLEITGAFCDEVNQLVEKAWNIVKSRIRYKLNDYGLKPKILGSTNPAKNWVYFAYYKPFVNKTIDSYKSFIPALVTDNPNISEFYVQNLKRLPEVDKQRLLYGNWDYDHNPDCIFTQESISNMFTNILPFENSERYISCDVAGTGTDRAVVILWRGLQATEFWISSKCGQDEIAEVINNLKRKHNVGNSNIIIDADGIGTGLADISFRGCRKFNNGASPIILDEKNDRGDVAIADVNKKFGNLKAQCYYRFAELAQACKISIKLDNINFFGYNNSIISRNEMMEFISAELDWARRKDPEKDSKIYMYPKEKIKEELGRSPDFADSLMMRFYYEIKGKPTIYELLKNKRKAI